MRDAVKVSENHHIEQVCVIFNYLYLCYLYLLVLVHFYLMYIRLTDNVGGQVA